MHDLANQMPEKVNEMKKMWEAWAKRAMVEPWTKIRLLEQAKNGK
jgi:hypothetical protein